MRPFLLISAAAFLSACGPAQAPAPSREKTLVIALSGDVPGFLSVLPASAEAADVISALSLPLLERTFDCGLGFGPGLATEWTFSEGGRQVDLTLREDVTWSDGVPVTAIDVAFTLNLLADPVVGSPLRAATDRMVEGARPRVLDDHHVRFRFREAYDPTAMLSDLASVDLLPAHVLKGEDRSSMGRPGFYARPTTSGPFRLRSRDPGRSLLLEPNPGWRGPDGLGPQVEGVELRIVPDGAERVRALVQGQVDVVSGLDPALAQGLVGEHPEIRLLDRGWRKVEFIAYNARDPERTDRPHPLFGDRRVRRALGRAVDVDRIMGALFPPGPQPWARRAVGTLSPSLCGLGTEEIQPLPLEPSRARAELEELGWRDSDGDGWLDREGRVFRFQVLNRSGQPRRDRVLALVRQDLAAIGVDVQVETVDGTTLWERAQRGAFDALLGSWDGALVPDPSAHWRSGPGHPLNLTGYANPEVDARIDQGLASLEPGARAAAWREVQRLVHEDQPYTFLYWMDDKVAVGSRVQGAEANILHPFPHLWRWRR